MHRDRSIRSLWLILIPAIALSLLPSPRTSYAAGIVVNSALDANPPATDGACTLREAIANANANAATFPDCPAGTGEDTITFASDIFVTLVAPLPPISDPEGLSVDGTGRLVTVHGGTRFEHSWVVAAGAVFHLIGMNVEGVSDPSEFFLMPRGIRNDGGTVTITRSTLQRLEQSVVNGAGGTLTVTDSTVTGGMHIGLRNLGTAILQRSTLSSNTAAQACIAPSCASGSAGGIGNQGTLTLVNSTVSGNSAPGFSQGGGVLNGTGATLSIVNSTITANTAGGVGGGVINTGTASVVNSVIAGNTAASGPDCAGAFTSPGPNLVGSMAGCALVGTAPITGDAHLGPLADNGGPTQTHALLFPSPAVDAGSNAICAAPPVGGIDQRGVARSVGAACDLGAVEGLTGVIGGKNMAITTGSVELAWESGNLQTGYGLLRNAPAGLSVVPLAAGATSYSDTAPTSGAYCYLLAAIDGSGLLGTSDLECAVTGVAQGSAPAGFTLSVNQSSNATMTWTASGSMSLVRVPLDGSPPTTTFLGSTASTIQPLGPAGDCFVLVRASSFGVSNALCGVPGFSSLGNTALAGETIGRLEAVGHQLTALSADLIPLTDS